jgi:UDPglucose 6-dehydrogenase
MKLTDAVLEVNKAQTASVINRVRGVVHDLKGKTIGVLGLSFKPETDDLRKAPALKIIEDLLEAGMKVRAYDLAAMGPAARLLKGVNFCEDEYEAARDADALIVVTEWNQFRSLDLNRLKSVMKNLNIVDLRNIYEPETVRAAGFKHVSIGRP